MQKEHKNAIVYIYYISMFVGVTCKVFVPNNTGVNYGGQMLLLATAQLTS